MDIAPAKAEATTKTGRPPSHTRTNTLLLNSTLNLAT